MGRILRGKEYELVELGTRYIYKGIGGYKGNVLWNRREERKSKKKRK